MTDAVTAADLMIDATALAQWAGVLRRSAEGMAADCNAFVQRLASMPPLATDIRIAPADWQDWSKAAARLDQLQAELDAGGCIIVLIGVQLYWLYSTDVKANTVVVCGAPLAKGTTPKTAVIKRASLNILGRWLIGKYGA